MRLFGGDGECKSNAVGHSVPDSVRKVIGMGNATSFAVLTKMKLIKKLPKTYPPHGSPNN